MVSCKLHEGDRSHGSRFHNMEGKTKFVNAVFDFLDQTSTPKAMKARPKKLQKQAINPVPSATKKPANKTKMTKRALPNLRNHAQKKEKEKIQTRKIEEK